MSDTRLDLILRHIDMPADWWSEGESELRALRAAVAERDILELQLEQYNDIISGVPGDTLVQKLQLLADAYELRTRQHYPYDET